MPKTEKKNVDSEAKIRRKKKRVGSGRQNEKALTDIMVDTTALSKQEISSKKRTLTKMRDNHVGPDVLNRLWLIIERRRNADPFVSHSARLLGRGTERVAQKFGEEAVECLIEIVSGNRTAAIAESADVLYHLLVMWVEAGIGPEEVWLELTKRADASPLVRNTNGRVKRSLGEPQMRTTKIP